MGSKNNGITAFFIGCLQNLLYGMAYGNKDFGYKFHAWANLILRLPTKFQETFFDLLKVCLLFLFFGSSQNRFNPKKLSFSVYGTNRFNRM